jgi:type II secretory pathway pseudopilin PulG
MLITIRRQTTNNTAESGFVLILALVVLLMLSLFGAWALKTSTFEINVAGGGQRAEKQFNTIEGAAYAEAGKVGFNLQPFYQLSDPSVFNKILTPTTDPTFNPGNDINAVLYATFFSKSDSIKRADPTNWPWENLLQNYDNLPTNTNEFDYRYLVTYVYATTPPMGYDTNSFSGYKFRIQGAAALTPTVVELGGTKVGVKASL